MTIKEYIDGLQKANMKPLEDGQAAFIDVLINQVSIWNNAACAGYAAAAAKKIGLPETEISRLLKAITGAFEEMNVEEAEEYYNHDKYKG